MITKTRTIALAAALGALAVPATAAAKPSKTDRQNAAQECKSERGDNAATREAFRARYGTNKNGKNAFGKCVSKRSRDEERERKQSRRNAAQACKAERGDTGESRTAFREQYGTNKSKRNAFGKCVSQKARAEQQQADAEDAERAEARKNAAAQCDEERGETADSRAAFREEYGTNRNKRNAFGKCVSQKAQAEQEAQQTS